MKKSIITYLIISLGLALTSFGQLIVESENATLSGGPSVTNYKSTSCVYMQSAGSITHNFNITKKGFYKLELRVAAPQYKEQFLYINNTIFSKLKMNENAGFYTIDMGAVSLNPGSNTIEIRAEWGYAYFDKVTLSAVAPVDYSKVKTTTINPKQKKFIIIYAHSTVKT
jgi:mannan endo-1,4-beta-mannosidase